MAAQPLQMQAGWRTGLPRDWSLRRRLMLLVSIGTVAAWLVGAVMVLLTVQAENERLHIARLHDFGRIFLRFAEHEIDEILKEHPGDVIHVETGATLNPRFRYQVRNAAGELLLVSANTDHAPFVPLETDGHVEVDIGGAEHYVYSMWNAGRTMQIQVIERADDQEPLLSIVGMELGAFFVLTIIGLLILNWWMVKGATRALDQAAQQIVNRSPGDLQPIKADSPPRELVPLLNAINCLFERMGRALAAEHRFSSNAAHELRTPLAAVKVQAQVAERARSAVGTHEALQQLGVCVERASGMIDQLLTLARVETTPIDPGAFNRVRLDEIVSRALHDLGPLLQERRIEVEARLEPASLPALEFGITSLARNLLENAAKYTPEGGTVRVESWEEGASVLLSVEDSGHGIPLEERERVFEPFYRLAGNTADGSGIGLSIVRSVIRVHGAQISLTESSLGGLRVRVRFYSGTGVPPSSWRRQGRTLPIQ